MKQRLLKECDLDHSTMQQESDEKAIYLECPTCSQRFIPSNHWDQFFTAHKKARQDRIRIEKRETLFLLLILAICIGVILWHVR